MAKPKQDEPTPEGAPEETFASNAPDAQPAPQRVTRTVNLEVNPEYATAPETWEHETLADRVVDAANLLASLGMISGVEQRKVRVRLRKAMYGGIAS